MIPFGLTERQFAERYRGILDRQTKSAVRTIREVLGKTVSDEVPSAQVEVFLDDSGCDAPAAWMHFSGKNARIRETDESIFPGRALKFELDLAALSDFDEEYFTSEFNGLGTAADVMRQWLAECWWKADGWSYPLPVVLAIHDGWGGGTLVSLTESAA
jgi:hypothetical protein